jgi:hypothetical protein
MLQHSTSVSSKVRTSTSKFLSWYGAAFLNLSRLYKLVAQHSNGRDVERTLINFENIHLTIRLCLLGAFGDDDRRIGERLQSINTRCPNLLHIQTLTSYEDEVNEAILGSRDYLTPRATRRVATTIAQKDLKLPVSPKGLQDIKNPFCIGLRQAYARDYQKANVIGLGVRSLQWFLRFSYMHKSVNLVSQTIYHNCSNVGLY